MTNRRDFLGLLAAAPIAAPIVAKEAMAAPYASGGAIRSISGVAGRTSIETLGIKLDTSELDKAFAQMRAIQQAHVTLGESDPPWPPEVPNRLKGTTINQDGDAI